MRKGNFLYAVKEKSGSVWSSLGLPEPWIQQGWRTDDQVLGYIDEHVDEWDEKQQQEALRLKRDIMRARRSIVLFCVWAFGFGLFCRFIGWL